MLIKEVYMNIAISFILFISSICFLSMYGDSNLPKVVRNRASWAGWGCSVALGVMLMAIFS